MFQANGKIKVAQTNQILLRMQMDNLVLLPPAKGQKKSRRIQKIEKTFQPPPGTMNLKTSEIEDLTIAACRSRQQKRLWRELIEHYHYVGISRLFGAQMRYLVFGSGKNLEQAVRKAFSRGKPPIPDEKSYRRLFDNGRLLLGALGFSAPAWKLSSREYFIGWNEKQRAKNLDLVVENSRFLILPWIKSPNLASRILGAITRRLPDDWHDRYGRRPVLLETFVQLDRFKGTCYLAANWIQIGVTEGYSLYGKYRKNAATKGIFVYPLDKNFKKILCETT
jgi:hypothetical protein